ncbi:hypothetical protein F5B22DRAFT_478814 [Xylaria bambusicola]|uniref:uncharacterized protein n=1 Tax=Xylaria bambusicola TaxID=326684 RepID=UPI0020088CF6|nr:uncharacterized protein F5B22DRAFT_478814 [Xylaria bambusicola]KAI0506106.1 hypothetical protein F5B22DRAFT_478814 [Xylaria bambusicola]
MSYARGPLRTLQLAAVLAIASATSIRASWLLERADTCPADYNKCTQAGLPANFCCAAGSVCNVLAGGTTVLCCPSNSDCSTIKIISCDISLQDADTHPKAAAKTTELDGKLPVCGKGCCPFGYHCDEASANCVMDKDQSQKPGTTPSSTSSAHASPTQTTSHPASTTKASTSTSETAIGTLPASATTTPSSEAASTMNTAAIVGGVVGGLLALALIFAGVWLLRHKRKKAAEERAKRDTAGSFGNKIRAQIGAPIPHADYYNQRLDFLAKAQSESLTSSLTRRGSHQGDNGGGTDFFPLRSPYSSIGFRPGSEMTDRPRSHHESAVIGGLRNLTDRYSSGSVSNPFTPVRGNRQHSGGSESINIFADPSTVGTPSIYNRRDTTWTEFQHHADQPQMPDSPSPATRRR